MTNTPKLWSLRTREYRNLDHLKCSFDIMVGNKCIGSFVYEYGFRVHFKSSPEVPPFRQTIFETFGEAIKAIERHVNGKE